MNRQLTINIGAPRTGTTTIQKHALNRIKNSHVFFKTPFTASGMHTNGEGAIDFSPKQLTYWIQTLENIESITTTKAINEYLISLSIGSCHTNTTYERICKQLLKSLIGKICSLSTKPIFIHNERYCDNAASLDGNSQHILDTEFAIYPLATTISDLGITPLISVCLRDPIEYLRSKYLRTYRQRKAKSLRPLSPIEYIQKQSLLEKTKPGSSALSPATHTQFIKQLQKHGFVKAFGFQELMNSRDIFSLMGLPREDQLSFKNFPKENKSFTTLTQDQGIVEDITKELKRQSMLSNIKNSQMFQ